MRTSLTGAFLGVFSQQARFFCSSKLASLWARPDSSLTLGLNLLDADLFEQGAVYGKAVPRYRNPDNKALLGIFFKGMMAI